MAQDSALGCLHAPTPGLIFDLKSMDAIGKYGRPEWTRTIDLLRVREAL